MRWKLAALTGWTISGLAAAMATLAMRKLGAELRATADDAAERLLTGIAPQPQGPDAAAWSMHLADEAAQLVEHGYENQATYLFGASGQLDYLASLPEH